MGSLRRARVGGRRARRRRGARRRRPRVRNGVLLGLAREAGARPVGVDVTPAQLETARGLQAETGIEFPLIEANAEDVPLPDASLRPRGLRVRREHLVRPVPLDPRGAPAASPRRAARVPARTARSSILCAVEEPDCDVRDACSARSAGCTGSSGRTAASSSTSPHGDMFRAAPRHRLRGREPDRALRARRRGDARATTRTSRPSGRGKWPAEEIWAARKPRLTLASTSPQRRAILEQLAIPFEVVAPDYVEDDPPDADPAELVRRARGGQGALGPRRRAASRSVSTRRSSSTTASTASPPTATDAARMLYELSGRTHTVVSGLCLLGAGEDVLAARDRPT